MRLNEMFEDGYGYVTNVTADSVRWYFDYTIIEDCSNDSAYYVVQCGKGEDLEEEGHLVSRFRANTIEEIKQKIKTEFLPTLIKEYNSYLLAYNSIKNSLSEEDDIDMRNDLGKIYKAYLNMKEW